MELTGLSQFTGQKKHGFNDSILPSQAVKLPPVALYVLQSIPVKSWGYEPLVMSDSYNCVECVGIQRALGIYS